MIKVFFVQILLISFCNLNSQNSIVCPYIEENVRIEDNNHVPLVENNSDGTISLIFDDSNMTSIFSNYSIYGFDQLNPTGSDSEQKNYKIKCNSRSLINDIYEGIDESIIRVIPYVQPEMEQTIIDKLDNRALQYRTYCTDNLEVFEEFCSFNRTEVPNDFNLILNCKYDSEKDMMIISTQGLTPCGNNLELGFKSGTTSWNPSLFLWYIDATAINNDVQSSFFIKDAEKFLMNMLGVGCEDTLHFGDLLISEDESSVDFTKDIGPNIFDRVSFQYSTLNKIDNIFLSADIVKFNANQARIIGVDSNDFALKAFELSGKSVDLTYDTDSKIIDIAGLAKGLYFFQFISSDKVIETLKFIK